MHEPQIIFDVAVIGGGLAGLTLAVQCAHKGIKVIIFEKETYPFHKVCGEYISNESLSFLTSLGFNPEKYNVPDINKLHLSDVSGNLYKFNLPLGGFGISRYTIDYDLYKLAIQKEAVCKTATKVSEIKFDGDAFSIQTNKGFYKSKVVASAYGKRSNIDIKMKRRFIQQKPGKLNNYLGIKYHIRYPFQKDAIALHNFYNGYCGISNIENDTCCLCYLTNANNLKENNNSIERMEKNVLFKNPFLKQIFSESVFLYPEPLVISQVSFNKKNQVEDHMLMIGDAAGLITPLCGNGMSMAMHAGKIAFEQITAFLQNKISRQNMEDNYDDAWKKNFDKRLFAGRIIQRLFGNNFTTSAILKLMSNMPFLAEKIIRTTHGNPF